MSQTDRVFVPLVLTALLMIPALKGVMNAEGAACDNDGFWQLQTGRWIVEHGELPATEPFSLHGQGKPLIAYSWLFQVLLYLFWRMLGLAGVVVFTLILMVLIAAALTNLLLKIHPRLMTVIPCVGLWSLMLHAAPRPWLFSILFFILELDILLSVARTGKLRYLCLLPVLFGLWANLHIQFIVGGVVLCFALLESAANRTRQFTLPAGLDVAENVPLYPLLIATVACVLATLANPYHMHVYQAAIELLAQKQLWNYIAELRAMPFRQSRDWLTLGFTLLAVFVIGWRRQVRLCMLMLFLFGIWSSFRSVRDVWIVLVAALVIIHQALQLSSKAEPIRLGLLAWTGISVPLAGLVSLLCAAMLSNERLDQKVRERYPEQACAHVMERRYPGPLYNHFDWGGYLIWRLHGADPAMLVGMDGRTIVYDEELILQQIRTWEGHPGWANDLDLRAARLVIADRDMALVSLLRCRSDEFELVHEDAVAVVFVRR